MRSIFITLMLLFPAVSFAATNAEINPWKGVPVYVEATAVLTNQKLMDEDKAYGEWAAAQLKEVLSRRECSLVLKPESAKYFPID
jgi:hypothetical protein